MFSPVLEITSISSIIKPAATLASELMESSMMVYIIENKLK